MTEQDNRPDLSLQIDRWLPLLEASQLDEAQKHIFVSELWTCVVGFVDHAWNSADTAPANDDAKARAIADAIANKAA